jgi:oxaloacetate decarboxylase (Na+ extruding) subunit alpha
VADIALVDVSLRDGNQSLWGATGLRTGHILQIAPVLDRAGFLALDYTSSTHMGVAVRTHREDPWERIRLTRAAAPRTPLQFIGSGLRFISWEPVHAVRRPGSHARHGRGAQHRAHHPRGGRV